MLNLEWVTAKENIQHAFEYNLNQRYEKCIKNLQNHNAKYSYYKIFCEKNGIINEFNNTNEASLFIGCHKDSITRAIKLNRPCCGYVVSGKRHTDC